MEKLNAEQTKAILLKIGGRETRVSLRLRTLQPGESLKVSRADWRGKQPPFYISLYLARKTGRKFLNRTLPDRSGWLIKRIS